MIAKTLINRSSLLMTFLPKEMAGNLKPMCKFAMLYDGLRQLFVKWKALTILPLNAFVPL